MSNTGSAEKFSITAIGTCRLDAPLRLGAQESGLSWTGQRIYGYAHSISECVQQVRFLKHEYVPDPALWDIIGKKNLKRALSERHQPSDLYLLEISSRKQLYVDEHAVQINHLKSKCFPFLSDVGRKTHYWNLLRRKDFAGQRQMVDDFAAEFGLSEHVHEILIKLRLEDTTDADLIKGLGEVREFLQEPTIVTHVNALDRMGQPIPSRALCVEQVERVSKSLGLAVFNPTSLMQEFGQDNAIEDESDSLAHFTEAFSGRLFERWHEEFLMRRIDEVLISTPTEPNRSKYAAHITSRAKLG